MEAIIGILFFAGFIALIFVIVYAISKSTFKRLNAECVKLAEEFGLETYLVEPKVFAFRPDYSTVEGKIGEHSVRVHFYRTGSGKHAQYWTAVDMSAYNPNGKDFTLKKENFLTKIGKAFGSQDIEIGDEDFDKQFILKSKDEAFLNSMLSVPIREQMKRVWIANRPAGTLELQGKRLKYVENGIMNASPRTRRIKEVLILMSVFATSLSDGSYTGQQSESLNPEENNQFF